MSKFAKPFVEVVYRIYAPEGSPLFAEMLDGVAYQTGIRDAIKAMRTGQSLQAVQNAHKPKGNQGQSQK